MAKKRDWLKKVGEWLINQSKEQDLNKDEFEKKEIVEEELHNVLDKQETNQYKIGYSRTYLSHTQHSNLNRSDSSEITSRFTTHLNSVSNKLKTRW